MDLHKFTLQDFSEIMHAIELLPGRRLLLDKLDAVLAAVAAMNLNTLADLRKLLKDKAGHAALAKKLQVDTQYLVVLNREINSYESRPLPLEKLEIFTPDELDRLQLLSIRTTKDYYIDLLQSKSHDSLIMQSSISRQTIVAAAHMVDLLRINGVGPVYAKILIRLGIKFVDDYQKMGADEILDRYREHNAATGNANPAIGLKDVEYCKRFCRKLDLELNRLADLG